MNGKDGQEVNASTTLSQDEQKTLLIKMWHAVKNAVKQKAPNAQSEFINNSGYPKLRFRSRNSNVIKTVKEALEKMPIPIELNLDNIGNDNIVVSIDTTKAHDFLYVNKQRLMTHPALLLIATKPVEKSVVANNQITPQIKTEIEQHPAPMLVASVEDLNTARLSFKALLSKCGARSGNAKEGGHYHTLRYTQPDGKLTAAFYHNDAVQAERTIDFLTKIGCKPEMGPKTSTSIITVVNTGVDYAAMFTEELKAYFPVAVAQQNNNNTVTVKKAEKSVIKEVKNELQPVEGEVTNPNLIPLGLLYNNLKDIEKKVFLESIGVKESNEEVIRNAERTKFRNLVTKSFEDGNFALVSKIDPFEKTENGFLLKMYGIDKLI